MFKKYKRIAISKNSKKKRFSSKFVDINFKKFDLYNNFK